MITATVVGIVALIILAWFEWEQYQHRKKSRHAHR